ncbi:MAG: GH1 family beta-glucosidase [Lachnospiraceae bacterium]
MGFRKDFIWGVATSAYQIEGASREDGKGATVWDAFCSQPEKILNGQNADIACDHYHRYKEDVLLMKQMGVVAYRFSIDWARILPDGIGKVNEQGIQFYDNLINELLEAGIEPYVTLFHWDYPLALERKGGWMNPESVEWFGDYAALVVEHFSDRVTHFFTMNEPQCFVGLGYLTGVHAPGLKRSLADTLLMAHHVLKAHGRAVQRMREKAKQPIEIGFAPTCGAVYPESEKPEDIEAARQCYFSIPQDDNWTWNVSWWSDPIFFGRYPEEGMKRFEQYMPWLTEADLKLISEPIDMYGQNLYNGYCVRAGKDGKPEVVERYDGFPRTAGGWPITPEALRWGPRFLYERYQKPIYITENGISCTDVISLDGKVHDPQRIDFTQRYLKELKKASDDGADVRGYFYWSFMDNFEWSEGYSQRFGLVYVDYRNQNRILKDSAYWYQQVIKENGTNL